MKISTIASGSSGNCVYISSDNTNLLVDTGISKKKTEEGLNSFDTSLEEIDGILLTHEHLDHVNGLGVISRKYNIPIYCTPGTHRAVMAMEKLGTIDEGLINDIAADSNFKIGDIDIHPFNISHDAAEPVAYRMSNGGKNVAVATDMGKFDDYIIENLKGLDSVVIEANHDERMLLAGFYPFALKQRILGDSGHLSNESSGRLINRILCDKVKNIILAHLSKDNNYEELAYQTVKTEIDTEPDNDYKSEDFNIVVAKRNMPSLLYTV